MRSRTFSSIALLVRRGRMISSALVTSSLSVDRRSAPSMREFAMAASSLSAVFCTSVCLRRRLEVVTRLAVTSIQIFPESLCKRNAVSYWRVVRRPSRFKSEACCRRSVSYLATDALGCVQTLDLVSSSCDTMNQVLCTSRSLAEASAQ